MNTMLKKEISLLLNQQINKELYSAYLYLDMANYYGDKNLTGFENWFSIQTKEEMDHAMLFRQYLLDNEEKVTLDTIEAPNQEFNSFKDPLVLAFEHEQFVTASINTIYEATFEHNDFRTRQFLDWFIKEQGEEEKNTSDLITKYELFGEDPKSLYLLNNELMTRVYTAPSLVL